ncbi:MAG: RNA polymerase sigma factor, partial [Planctomycetota bacterium]
MATLARRLTGRSEPEDVVQAALAAAWKHFEVSETIHNPRGWLLRFVVHESGNVIGRRMRRLSTVELEDGAPSGPVEDIVTTLQREIAYSSSRDPRVLLDYVDEGLSQAVQALHEDERQTLTLRAVGEFSYKEISEVMGVPIGTVMSRLCRAREKVRVELDRRSAGPSAAGVSERDSTERDSKGAGGGCPT